MHAILRDELDIEFPQHVHLAKRRPHGNAEFLGDLRNGHAALTCQRRRYSIETTNVHFVEFDNVCHSGVIIDGSRTFGTRQMNISPRYFWRDRREASTIRRNWIEDRRSGPPRHSGRVFCARPNTAGRRNPARYSEHCRFSKSIILSRRRSWRPPSKSVLSQTSTIRSINASPTRSAGRHKTLALLCRRDISAVSSS
jgi:hypothetical protein